MRLVSRPARVYSYVVRAIGPLCLLVGISFLAASAKNCAYSKEFQLSNKQALFGVLKDPTSATLPGVRLELLSKKQIMGTVVTGVNGNYSFGEVPAGRYRIRIQYGGDTFCAPKVKCDSVGCSISDEVKLNPKNMVEVW